MKVSVTFSVSLPVQFKKKGKYFIGGCPILDVWTQGETQEKAKENLGEALQMFLLDCFERGTLEQVLKECGFAPMTKATRKTKPIQAPNEEISIPLPFIIDENLARCHG